ncbi:MAG: hypothetical protein WC900_06825 [Oscillospiraceae bacterium]|jgi:hypothetical protein
MSIVDFVSYAKRLGFSVSICQQHKSSEKIIVFVEYPHPPSKNSLISLLKELPKDYSIEFFDYYKGALNDPMSYISALKTDSGYSMSTGINEWTSNKSLISFDSLADNISKNWEHSDAAGNFKNQIIIEPV